METRGWTAYDNAIERPPLTPSLLFSNKVVDMWLVRTFFVAFQITGDGREGHRDGGTYVALE